jgi:hypothetical protein
MMLVETYSESKAYVKIDLVTLTALLTCETVKPIFRSALKCAFMSARLMLRTLRGPSFGLRVIARATDGVPVVLLRLFVLDDDVPSAARAPLVFSQPRARERSFSVARRHCGSIALPRRLLPAYYAGSARAYPQTGIRSTRISACRLYPMAVRKMLLQFESYL